MKINSVWLEVDSGGEVVMGASKLRVRSRFNFYVFEIFPANAPSAIRFFEAFEEGQTLDERDARQVSLAVQHERAQGRWKIVDMKIEPDDNGVNVLKATLESAPLKVTTSLWPPRTPSARLFLEAFQNGRELFDKDLRLLKKFIEEEASVAGLVKGAEHGVLDWSPNREDYL